MPKKTESTLHFTVGRSRRLQQAIDGLHILSLSACWLNDLSIVYALVLSLLLLVSWPVQRKACETGCIFLRYTLVEG